MYSVWYGTYVFSVHCVLFPTSFVQAFMTVVWTVLEVMFVFCFFELPRVQEPSVERTLAVNEGEDAQVSGYGAVNSAVNNGNLGDSGTGRSLDESKEEESGPNQPLLGGITTNNVPEWRKMSSKQCIPYTYGA